MVSGGDGCAAADKEHEQALVVYADLRDLCCLFSTVCQKSEISNGIDPFADGFCGMFPAFG